MPQCSPTSSSTILPMAFNRGGEFRHIAPRRQGTSRLDWRNPSSARWPAAGRPAQFASAAVYVRSLDLGRAIGDALGLADAMSCQFALAHSAFDQLLTVRRIHGLVVNCVERCSRGRPADLYPASNPLVVAAGNSTTRPVMVPSEVLAAEFA
jgi:hypothetical protein